MKHRQPADLGAPTPEEIYVAEVMRRAFDTIARQRPTLAELEARLPSLSPPERLKVRKLRQLLTRLEAAVANKDIYDA